MKQTVTKKSTACFLAIALVFGMFGCCLVGTGTAYADNTDTDKLLAEAQEKIEQTAKDYDDAAAKVDEIQQEIEANEGKIKDLEASLPEQEAKSAVAVVSLYKMQQDGFSLVNMVLNAGSLDEFLASIEYISTIQQTNMNEITRLRLMKEELQDTKASLQESKMTADAEKNRAEEALKEAQAAREEAQQKALEEAARQEAARQAELARQEAERQAASGGSDDGSDGSPAPAPSIGGVDWNMGKDDFVNMWAGRIDAYLAGSPLAGQGRTFAEAAWNYGVDPRFSPAISCTESSKGLYCFQPYNAWGWGSSSWTNWGDAINTHVRGLANGYGGTISLWGAQKYCPPNWEHWYYTTLSEMNKI